MTAVERVRELSDRARATRDLPIARDVALAGARLGLAWVFIYTGGRTLFGIFGGPGIHGAAPFFANVAHLHPGILFATLSGITEFFGGIGVGVGVLGRLAAAALVGDMVVAMATVTFGNGMTSSAPGGPYTLNLALATLALAVAILGTGRLSLDELLRRQLGWTSATTAGRPVAGRLRSMS